MERDDSAVLSTIVRGVVELVVDRRRGSLRVVVANEDHHSGDQNGYDQQDVHEHTDVQHEDDKVSFRNRHNEIHQPNNKFCRDGTQENDQKHRLGSALLRFFVQQIRTGPNDQTSSYRSREGIPEPFRFLENFHFQVMSFCPSDENLRFSVGNKGATN